MDNLTLRLPQNTRNGQIVSLPSWVLSSWLDQVNIRRGGLHLRPGRTHVQQEVTDTTLWAGAHNTRGLIILSDDGHITFDAIDWCRKQGISIIHLDLYGNVVFTVGEIGSDVGLRRCQYQGEDTGMAGYVAREVIRLKTMGQISVLKKSMPSHPLVPGQTEIIGGRRVIIKKGEVIRDEYIWETHERRLPELSKLTDIDAIRSLEAHLAFKYWECFTGIPIHWKWSSACG